LTFTFSSISILWVPAREKHVLRYLNREALDTGQIESIRKAVIISMFAAIILGMIQVLRKLI
jgi:hypothetical protein